MSNKNIIDLTPASLTQLVHAKMVQLLYEHISDMTGLVRVTGRLTKLGEARSGKYYGVKVTGDGGAEFKADIPQALAVSHRLAAGQQVRMTGTLRFETRYGLEVRLSVSAIDLINAEGPGIVAVVADRSQVTTLEYLKSLAWRRHAFPSSLPSSVAIVQSESLQARVAEDCQGELVEMERQGYLTITPFKVNILDPMAVAGAIQQARADILVVIRGGGDSRDFAVFDDSRVVQALVNSRAYRVVGLGHSGDGTVLDMVADFSASTPTAAGTHIREQVMASVRGRQEVDDAVRYAQVGMQQLLDKTTRDLEELRHSKLGGESEDEGTGMTWYSLMGFGAVIGAVLVWILLRH